MAEESTAMTRSEAAPSYIAEVSADDVNKLLTQFVRPPRIKVVQGTAKPPLSDNFRAGDVVLMPAMVGLAEAKTEITVVPIFFFPEWYVMNPLEADMMIRDRTTDPASEIAVKSRDPKKRKEPWPEQTVVDEDHPQRYITYVESLNFICEIVGHPNLTGQQVAFSFARAEHKTGTNWASSLKMKNLPLFASPWAMKTSQRTNPKGSWWGFDISPTNEFVDEETFTRLRAAHDALFGAYEEGRIEIDHAEDESTDSTPSPETNEF